MKQWALGLGFLMTCLFVSSFVLAQDLSDIERDARALELYIKDKQDHEDHCPELSWNQPSLDTYKETLVSHLPEGCKK